MMTDLLMRTHWLEGQEHGGGGSQVRMQLEELSEVCRAMRMEYSGTITTKGKKRDMRGRSVRVLLCS